MRTVQFVANLDTGGLERMVLDLARCQVSEGHQSIIYCLNRPGRMATEAEELGITVSCFAKPSGFHLPTLLSIKRQLCCDRPDVLHTHNHLVHHYGVIAGRLARVPVIVNTRHGVDRALIAGPDRSAIGTNSPDWKADLIFRATLPWVDRVVLISEATRNFYVNYRGIPARKTRVILNGARLDRFFSSPARPGSDPMRIRFGTAARMVPEKDHFTMLRAFGAVVPSLPAAELHLAGSGPTQPALQAFATKLNLADHVKFLGEVIDIPRFLSGLDVFVLSSLTEGLPVAVLEAMAAGLPIVSTRAGGVEEVAVDGYNAFLVEPADSDGLARAMLRMARDSRLAEFGSAGRKLVQDRFRIETTWHNYCELYRECGAGRALPLTSLAHR
jgi:glycosyltransferase involved in cell wall biosynthesis